MSKIHTHYDNLKVSRDAPVEVIRAAYRSLSQKHHPDRNSGDAQSAQTMKLINAAYAVLSDPQKRREHDAWIAREEQLQTQSAFRQGSSSSEGFSNRSAPGASPYEPAPVRRKSDLSGIRRLGGVLVAALLLALRLWPLTLILGVILYSNFSDPAAPPRGPRPYVATPAESAVSTSDSLMLGPTALGAEQSAETSPVRETQIEALPVAPKPEHIRPLLAPNGHAWPAVAGYLTAEPRLNASGLSEVTVDNGQNDSDVHVKLVAITDADAHPVRQFFIPAHAKFTAKHVDAGHYDVRYRELDSGHLSRSEAFDLLETPTPQGVQYSSVELTLFKVANGNMQTYDLAEEEF